MSEHAGNDSSTSSDQDLTQQGFRGSTRYNSGYPSSRGGYSARGYHRGGGQSKYNGHPYDYVESTSQDFSNGTESYPGYRGQGQADNDYRSDYYYNGQVQGNNTNTNTNNRYYSGRGGYAYGYNHGYGQSYQTENDYQYYGGNRRGASHPYYQSRGAYHSTAPPPSRNQSFPDKTYPAQQSYVQTPPRRSSGNNTPIDTFNRSSSQSSTVNIQTRSISAAISPLERRIDKKQSPFLYLTNLDESTSDSVKLDEIKRILGESDSLDRKLEEGKLRILQGELELGLLSTQCDRDSLNVQLTQEKLDSLLMQG